MRQGPCHGGLAPALRAECRLRRRPGRPPTTAAHSPLIVRNPTLRDLRLASGLVLFFYVATHLANHALGLVSIAVAERGLAIAVGVWQSLPGTLLLYGAAAAHVTLAFAAIYRRRTLRMPPAELLRIFLGLGIPMLLIGHAIGTRVAWSFYDASPEYRRVVWGLWNSDGEGRQLALLVPGWLHGCLGLHFAFNRRRAYQRMHYVLFGAAILLPVLAGLGFLAMGKELAARTAEHAALMAQYDADASLRLSVSRLRDGALAVYFSLIAGVFAARELRALVERRRRTLVRIAYPGRSVQVPRGWTVLEASRSFHIPHMSMCGGRARCSTCRVQVTAGLGHCPPPEADEAATLVRIAAPPGVRLACQLRPTDDIAVVPLLAATAAPPKAARDTPVERGVALVAVDWRNRAAFGRDHLPQDRVYASRLFADVVAGSARASGGVEAESAGAGAVVLYGLADPLPDACRAALAAARSLEDALHDLAQRLAHELNAQAAFTVCLHAGPAAAGAAGLPDGQRTIAAGPALDEMERLRAFALRSDAAIVVSPAFAREAGMPTPALHWRDAGGAASTDAGSGLRAATLRTLANYCATAG